MLVFEMLTCKIAKNCLLAVGKPPEKGDQLDFVDCECKNVVHDDSPRLVGWAHLSVYPMPGGVRNRVIYPITPARLPRWKDERPWRKVFGGWRKVFEGWRKVRP